MYNITVFYFWIKFSCWLLKTPTLSSLILLLSKSLSLYPPIYLYIHIFVTLHPLQLHSDLYCSLTSPQSPTSTSFSHQSLSRLYKQTYISWYRRIYLIFHLVKTRQIKYIWHLHSVFSAVDVAYGKSTTLVSQYLGTSIEYFGYIDIYLLQYTPFFINATWGGIGKVQWRIIWHWCPRRRGQWQGDIHYWRRIRKHKNMTRLIKVYSSLSISLVNMVLWFTQNACLYISVEKIGL